MKERIMKRVHSLVKYPRSLCEVRSQVEKRLRMCGLRVCGLDIGECPNPGMACTVQWTQSGGHSASFDLSTALFKGMDWPRRLNEELDPHIETAMRREVERGHSGDGWFGQRKRDPSVDLAWLLSFVEHQQSNEFREQCLSLFVRSEWDSVWKPLMEYHSSPPNTLWSNQERIEQMTVFFEECRRGIQMDELEWPDIWRDEQVLRELFCEMCEVSTHFRLRQLRRVIEVSGMDSGIKQELSQVNRGWQTEDTEMMSRVSTLLRFPCLEHYTLLKQAYFARQKAC